MSFTRRQLADAVHKLAAGNIFIGTSSWKYPGWCGTIYDPARYEWRGKFAQSRFQRNCLAEYAEVFRTVSVDAAYYTFPTEKYLDGLAQQTPVGFLFGFKVTDAITIKRYPNMARFGDRAGKANENFLNAELFSREFLRPCEAIRPKVGLLMFEFSRFWPSEYQRGHEFIADLDRFLGELPKGWPYGVEMRNKHWLTPEYFACLARHGVTHIFNSWTDMPPVSEQMALPGSRTKPESVAARFLLKPGRKYEEAVKAFEPYDKVVEIYPDARAAGRALIVEGVVVRRHRRTFIYINNRLEGNAIAMIQVMADRLEELLPA